MLLLGLLLVVLAAAVAVGAMLDAGESATVEILGQTITTTVAGVFVAGAVTMLTFLLGVWAISASMGRARRKRAQRKEAKRSQRDSVRRLEEERAALREENERLSSQLTDTRPSNTPSSAGTGAAAGAGTGAVAAGDADSHDHDHSPSSLSSPSSPSSPSHETHEAAGTPEQDRDERVVDHRSDDSSESSTGGRHRDMP